jgi:hypothetical protein
MVVVVVVVDADGGGNFCWALSLEHLDFTFFRNQS